jgi:hypothetical protein
MNVARAHLDRTRKEGVQVHPSLIGSARMPL